MKEVISAFLRLNIRKNRKRGGDAYEYALAPCFDAVIKLQNKCERQFGEVK